MNIGTGSPEKSIHKYIQADVIHGIWASFPLPLSLLSQHKGPPLGECSSTDMPRQSAVLSTSLIVKSLPSGRTCHRVKQQPTERRYTWAHKRHCCHGGRGASAHRTEYTQCALNAPYCELHCVSLEIALCCTFVRCFSIFQLVFFVLQHPLIDRWHSTAFASTSGRAWPSA